MDAPTPGDEGPQEDLKYGCSHYRRKCKFVVRKNEKKVLT